MKKVAILLNREELKRIIESMDDRVMFLRHALSLGFPETIDSLNSEIDGLNEYKARLCDEFNRG